MACTTQICADPSKCTSFLDLDVSATMGSHLALTHVRHACHVHLIPGVRVIFQVTLLLHDSRHVVGSRQADGATDTAGDWNLEVDWKMMIKFEKRVTN